MIKKLLLFFFKKTIWNIHCEWDHQQAEAEERELYRDERLYDEQADSHVDDYYDNWEAPKCQICDIRESVTGQNGKYVCSTCFIDCAISIEESSVPGVATVEFFMGDKYTIPINKHTFDGRDPLFLNEKDELLPNWEIHHGVIRKKLHEDIFN